MNFPKKFARRRRTNLSHRSRFDHLAGELVELRNGQHFLEREPSVLRMFLVKRRLSGGIAAKCQTHDVLVGTYDVLRRDKLRRARDAELCFLPNFPRKIVDQSASRIDTAPRYVPEVFDVRVPDRRTFQ